MLFEVISDICGLSVGAIVNLAFQSLPQESRAKIRSFARISVWNGACATLLYVVGVVAFITMTLSAFGFPENPFFIHHLTFFVAVTSAFLAAWYLFDAIIAIGSLLLEFRPST